MTPRLMHRFGSRPLPRPPSLLAARRRRCSPRTQPVERGTSIMSSAPILIIGSFTSRSTSNSIPTTGHFFAEVGQPISVTDLMPYSEFIETRFYREWVQPQGVVDFLAAVLDKSVTRVAMFGVFRHERDGLVDDEARRRIRLVVPHVRRAVLVSRIIDLK